MNTIAASTISGLADFLMSGVEVFKQFFINGLLFFYLVLSVLFNGLNP